MTINSSAVGFKERERESRASAAAGWSRRDELLREGAEPVTGRRLELAGIAPGQRVLDIASGTGVPARVAFINDVIDTASAEMTGESLRMQGTTWIAAAEK